MCLYIHTSMESLITVPASIVLAATIFLIPPAVAIAAAAQALIFKAGTWLSESAWGFSFKRVTIF